MRAMCPVCLFVAIFTPALVAQELTAPDIKSDRPTPRTADGNPDITGYWHGIPGTPPVGDIGQALPGLRPPLITAGDAALKHNLTGTIALARLSIHGENVCD